MAWGRRPDRTLEALFGFSFPIPSRACSHNAVEVRSWSLWCLDRSTGFGAVPFCNFHGLGGEGEGHSYLLISLAPRESTPTACLVLCYPTWTQGVGCMAIRPRTRVQDELTGC